MNNIILEVFCVLYGISSPSGLFLDRDRLFIVSDNSNYLYAYHLRTQKQSIYRLVEAGAEPLENIPKSIKKDLEAITGDGRYLYLFGSGSTDKRNSLFIVQAEEPSKSQEQPIGTVYNQLSQKHGIHTDDFNIEGALIKDDLLYLFNRGNGPLQKNGVFTLSKSLDTANSTWTPIPLPHLSDIPSGFTDAIHHEGRIYFIASSEAGGSTYEDGEVGGSLIGALDVQTMEVLYTKKITDNKKLEGLTLLKDEDGYLTFLLCEDPDDDRPESSIYSLKLKKSPTTGGLE